MNRVHSSLFPAHSEDDGFLLFPASSPSPPNSSPPPSISCQSPYTNIAFQALISRYIFRPL